MKVSSRPRLSVGRWVLPVAVLSAWLSMGESASAQGFRHGIGSNGFYGGLSNMQLAPNHPTPQRPAVATQGNNFIYNYSAYGNRYGAARPNYGYGRGYGYGYGVPYGGVPYGGYPYGYGTFGYGTQLNVYPNGIVTGFSGPIYSGPGFQGQGFGGQGFGGQGFGGQG